MKRQLIHSLLIAIPTAVLLAGIFLAKTIPEPLIMIFSGTGLIDIARIFKKKPD